MLDADALRERVEELAAIERRAGSAGEKAAAVLIADELRSLGARVEVEEERVHGTYWWPLGLLAALGVAGAVSNTRFLRLAAGALAVGGAWDDLRLNRRFVRRRLLRQKRTLNVVAEFGDASAEDTVLVIAHYDAAHSGLVFHPEIPRVVLRRFPWLLARSNTTPPTMWGTVAGPAMVALSSVTSGRLGRRLRGLGALVSLGYVGAMIDIGLRRVVPAANDNASGVAAMLSLAHTLAAQPPRMRVLLLATGSEESILEGMCAFGRRHFATLPRDRTHVINIDTVGSPRLLVLEAEGMLGMWKYGQAFVARVHGCARELEIELVPKLRFRNATDGAVALKAGYQTVTLASVDEYKTPSNYHWPTDTPENVNYETVADAARLVNGVIRELDVSASAARSDSAEL